jgi:hypothetical protein
MKFNRKNSVSAFTIFEVTIVLGLMSAIISIIAVSFNRFNEQLKNSSEIHAELNTFFAFRANLWNELYTSDSIVCQKNQVIIFKNNKAVEYRIEEDILERKSDEYWVKTNFLMLGIQEEIKDEDQIISFTFDWKGESMKLHYFCKPDLKHKIDHYFENFE